MDAQIIIEPDIKENTGKRQYCKSCLRMSEYHLEGTIKVCYSCGQPMVKGESLSEAAAKPEQPTKKDTLTLQEMSANTSKAKKAFETLEKQLDRIRLQKFQSLEANETEKVIELSHEDTKISAELDKAFSLWQICKKNFEYSALDSENRILSEAKLKNHMLKVDERSASANVFLNMIAELNLQISLVDDASVEFKTIQSVGLNDSAILVNWLKQNHIGRIGIIEPQQIAEDSVGSIVPVKQELGREATLLENNLSKIEEIILNIRKAIFPSLLRRGD